MDEFCRKFYFVHIDGDELYAVRMRNQDTGRWAFRVSLKGNRKIDGQEVEEDEMIRLVRDEFYAVRMTTLDRTRPVSLYKRNGPSVRDVKSLD